MSLAAVKISRLVFFRIKKIDESQFWASSGPFFLSLKSEFWGNFWGVKPDGSLDEVEGWIPVPLPL